MQIDWFTFTAQIVNFLVLVWLLKKFLYGPITRAMEERQQKIIKELQNARQAQQEAKRAAAEYRAEQEALQHAKERLLAEASRDVEEFKRQQLQAVRAELEQTRAQWYDSLRREKTTIASQLVHRATRYAQLAARRILALLAGASLERRMVEVFIERLSELQADELESLHRAIADSGGKVVVETAFSLASEDADELQKVISSLMPSDEVPAVEFRQQPDLICGLELHAGGYKVPWNAAVELEQLSEQLRTDVEGVIA